MKSAGLVLTLLLCASAFGQGGDFSKWVDPFIGTGGTGHTFPGATVPFGMVQLSPDTRTDNWNGSSGYYYSDNVIYGFSHTHLSGTGIPDYCDILLMPTVGEPQFEAGAGEKEVNGYASKFSHASEKAQTGYYSVKLEDDNILAEMTATKRVGFHRYTFPKTGKANIILDLKWRDKVLDSGYSIVDNNRIEGFRRSSSWAKDQVVYFTAVFSKPFINVTNNQAAQSGGGFRGKDLKAAFQFKTAEGEQIKVKVALSPVSIEGARANLAAELPGWNFDKVRADAKAAWNKELGKIEISGGTDAQTKTFYTALYHTMIQPNIFQDVDGSYRGLDGKTHNIAADGVSGAGKNNPNSKLQNPNPDNYTVFSLWDTFRAAHPLYTIIDRKRTADFINTFIRQYEQGGRLPVWELAANETDTMIGFHAVSVIADAMAKGIEGFDYEKAYEAAKQSAERDSFGLAAYRKRGYVSAEDEQESVSKTLEYAYDNWCVAQMARILMRKRQKSLRANGNRTAADEQSGILAEDYKRYFARGGYFENLFDPETGFMRARQNGGFVRPFAPNEITFNYTEGNAWQYSFFVPQNVPRLIGLYGGREKFVAKLDELFSTDQKLAGREQPDVTGLIGQYAQGNEPSHHIAYLYNYAGEPAKAQKILRRIMDEFYKPTPDGLIGNEDCGQMSAWYILSASGFYQVAPGDPVYALGTPLFKEVRYNLENGKTFVIKAPNNSEKNIYVRSVKLNGVEQNSAFIRHKDIAGGGVLEFEMSDIPPAKKYPAFVDLKPSGNFVAVPVITSAGRVFSGTATVSLAANTADAKIYYTTDGTEPTEKSREYFSPFKIDKTTSVKAIAVNSAKTSLAAEAKFYKKPNDWTVKIASRYNRQYTGGGDEGLIDGIRGTINFTSGEWQGYQPEDLIATIDLKNEIEIRQVGGGFLQNARSWIWMPTSIEFEISSDNVNFTKIAEIKTDVAPEEMTPVIRDYTAEIVPVKARYVRVRARNSGKIPAWHPGAGDDAFIFVDEIFIR